MYVARMNAQPPLNTDCVSATTGVPSATELDTITFEPGGVGTLVFNLAAGVGDDAGDLNTGTAAVSGPLLIEKNAGSSDITISGNLGTRILNVDVGGDLTVHDITLSSGKDLAGCGAVLNGGALTLDKVNALGTRSLVLRR